MESSLSVKGPNLPRNLQIDSTSSWVLSSPSNGGRELTLSSQYQAALPDALKAAGVRATDSPSRLIDDFARGKIDATVAELAEERSVVQDLLS